MTHLNNIQNKIIDRKNLNEQLQQWKKENKKIVFTNGCFDILHLGHIDYLSKAADMGDVLLIGLNADESVSRLKGPHRPINNEQSRGMILAALEFVNAVVKFEEDTPYELIKQVQPDVLVKGADYKIEQIVGHDVVQAKGGEVRTIDYLPGYSTSGIEKKIKEG
ncbi:MAG: D-glycero-beta-D-manno-heptose 1-phosphate adenylyltransferase [Bacteroidia bacterium]